MDTNDLRVFAAVARIGSMSRAATELNTVQSNVTTRIAKLEAELGVALFHRSSLGVAPTAAARRLLPYAERLPALLEEAAQAARDDGTPRGPLTVGALETTAARRLAPLLAGYTGSCPDVDLSLVTGTTCELTNAVLERRVEGAFVCGPVAHPALAAEPMFREELVLLTAPGGDGIDGIDALACSDDVRLVVLRAGCSYRQRLEALLAARGAARMRLAEFGTIDGIVGCVSAGLGITLLPRSLAEPHAAAGRVVLHPLGAADAEVETLFIRREDSRVSSALAAFLEHVRPRLTDRAAAE